MKNDIKGSQDKQMRADLETIGNKGQKKKRLLLHACCAPCASYAVKTLTKDYDITLFFYNPNIEPYEEYIKRKNEVEKLAVMQSLHLGIYVGILECEYDNELFTSSVRSLRDEPEGGARCKICFDIRLGETARQARAHGFDVFATTLSTSPHKNAAILNDSGIMQSMEHNILYLRTDFKKNNGYMQSIELSKEYGLYRQNYCGCKIS